MFGKNFSFGEKNSAPNKPKVGFTGRLKPLIALDISSMAVKLLELGKKGRKFSVESYAVEPLPPNAVQERRIVDEEAVGETIRRAVKRAKTKTKDAAIAVPGSAIISKTLSIPTISNEAELEGQIEVEVEKHIPFPLEEINYDFTVMGPNEQDPERTDVLLVASRNENVDSRVVAVEIGGLNPRVMDVEPYALEHACTLMSDHFIDHGRDRTIAVVDIGATMSILTVLHDMETVYVREQQFGGKQLTEDIMRQFGLSHEEAGRTKRQGGLPENYNREVLEPFRQGMAQQVNRALQYFLTSGDYSHLDHVVLAGGCAQIPDIDRLVEGQIGAPVTISNPFEGMSIGPRVQGQALARDAAAMTMACGLALRGFD